MKKLFFFLMLALVSFSAAAQPVTLTFTGRDAKNQHVQLNRVVITNLTQNWQETIYYPDTILMMGSTGIGEVDHANGMKLSQNVPNPFDGTTDFALQLPEAGKVSLTVYDLNGKKITAYQGKLAAGVHTFRVLLNTTQSYLLTARCGNETASIKMINNGNAGENAICHLGEGNLNMMLKSGTKGTTSKPFAFGDNMIYMGYAIINGKECVSQTVEKRQLISETITLQFDNYPPTVTTASITEITSHSAMSGGEVLQDGGSAVITKGVCWSTKANPTINDSHIAAGSGLGSFVSALTGLTYGTTYYVRAYAENSNGVAYGNEQTFTTVTITPPVVTTAVVSNVTNNSAICGGTIQDMGLQITGRGVCWSTSPNPTVENSCTNDGVGAGTFTSSIKNLDHSTLYYVRAYAITVDGTFYGDEKSFTTQEAQLPLVVTQDVTEITCLSVACSYTVVDRGTYVTARGVCWSTQPNPTVADNHTTDGIGAGTFTSQLTNLQEVTTYYVRAYATNSDGTAYGEEKSFTTLFVKDVVLLEMFTGQGDGYSPDGHRRANLLAKANPGRFFDVRIHAGPLARQEMLCSDATTLYDGFSLRDVPYGLVNRNDAGVVGRSVWSTQTSLELQKGTCVKMSARGTLNIKNNELKLTVEMRYVSALSATNFLCAYVLEDSVWALQANGKTYNPDYWDDSKNLYCHMHVLRGCITDPWGEEFSVPNEVSVITKEFTYQVPKICGTQNVDLNHINVIVFVCQEQKYNVLDVVQAEITRIY